MYIEFIIFCQGGYTTKYYIILLLIFEINKIIYTTISINTTLKAFITCDSLDSRPHDPLGAKGLDMWSVGKFKNKVLF